MSGLFFISIRRLRAPLVFLIVVFTVSTVGFALIPGAGPDGRPWHPNLFEAFYFVTYTATTIGFGRSLIDPSVTYPGGNTGHHVTGMQNLVTASASPIDPTTFAPLAGSPLSLPLMIERPGGLLVEVTDGTDAVDPGGVRATITINVTARSATNTAPVFAPATIDVGRGETGNGVDLLHALHARQPDLVAVMVTAWARAFRMKCTRQRCQVALRIFETAARMPSWASETTSLTPRRPRRVNERRKSVQNGSASEAPTFRPSTSRRPCVLAPMAIITATEMMRRKPPAIPS